MNLHVERTGTGPDLALLHGWGLHSGAWDELLPELALRHRVHAVDLPGHGHSASVVADSFDDAVGIVAAVLPKGALVCGWSLGGLIAQRLAQQYPQRVARLLLVASTPCFVERADWAHGMKDTTLTGFAQGLGTDRDATLARFVRLNALHGARGREAIRAFTARLGAHGPASVEGLAASLGWLRTTDLRAGAAAIAAPTLVVHGARDALTPAEAGRWLARHIPGARLAEIGDAGHLPFFSHRAAFAAALESHLG